MVEPRSTFGEELRRRRQGLGLSLTGLARIAFYSKGHLSKIENGLAVPQLEQAWQLDSVLGAGGELARLVPDARAPASPGPPGSTVTPPSGLPTRAQHFVGRDGEFTTLVARLSGVPDDPGDEVVCVVDGMAGVGKTALAVKVARALSRRFPDGCLFLDLHGYTGSVPPLSAGEALDRLLRRLGLPVPADPDERSVRFRDHLARHRILLILDNAISSGQVRPLIPASAESRLLVTSRGRLSSLDGAFHLTLDVLSDDEATRFFKAALDGEGEQEHVAQIVGLCGGLPLALTIMAARSRVTLIEELASSVRHTRDRLAEIADGERSVRHAFEISYQALPEAPREMLCLLGLYPGGDWTAHQVAALGDLDLATARQHLERLSGARLIERNAGRRFEIHDLIGDFARAKGAENLPPDVQRAARHRLLAWSLDMAARADEVITPDRYRPFVEPTGRPVPFGDEAAASAWLADEAQNLVAACRLAFDLGADSTCWRLAALLRGHFFLAKRWDDWLATHAWALTAAQRAGDRDGEAMTRNNLGLALMELDRLDAADEQFRLVMDGFPDAGDGHARANALGHHAFVCYMRGAYEESLRFSREALAFYEAHGRERNRAITLRGIGLVEIELGRYDEAIEHITTALEVFSEPGGPLSIDRVMAFNCLGEALLRAGRPAEAESWLIRGVTASRDCRSLYEEARALRRLGEVARAQGRPDDAGDYWRAAHTLFNRLGAPEAAMVAEQLAAGL